MTTKQAAVKEKKTKNSTAHVALERVHAPTPISGIGRVDLRIEAEGEGVVNWNGSIKIRNPEEKKDGDNKAPQPLSNHKMPKLRGYTNIVEGASADRKKNTDFKYADDIDFTKNPLFISDNCIRHALFKDSAADQWNLDQTNLVYYLASQAGLLRGYVLPNKNSQSSQATSSLSVTPFVDQLGNGYFEQYNRSGELSSNSIFSVTNFGDTQYEGCAEINIEELQFIPLSPKFGRCAINIIDQDDDLEPTSKAKKGLSGSEVASGIQNFLENLKVSLKQSVEQAEYDQLTPTATFGKYIRRNTIFKNNGQLGILLNQDAIHLLVLEMINRFKNLSIRRTRGYMQVTKVEMDYNETAKLRVKTGNDRLNVNPVKEADYAIYYEPVASTDQDQVAS